MFKKPIYGIIVFDLSIKLNGVRMLKKYFYVIILLGALILLGRTDNEVDTKEITDEVSPIPLNLTQEQKEDYHKQYFKIVEDLKAEYQFSDMVLVPLDEFLEEDWVEPEEFRNKLVTILKTGYISLNND